MHVRILAYGSVGLILAFANGCSDAALDDTEEGEAVAATGLELRVAAVAPGSSLITYSIINHSDSPVALRPWQSLSLEQSDALLQVSRHGAALPYRGPAQPRAAVDTQYRLEVEPRQALTAQIDVAQFYDLAGGGEFEVQARPLPAGMLNEAGLEVHVAAALRLDVSPQTPPDSQVVATVLPITLGSTCNPQDLFGLSIAHSYAYQDVVSGSRAYFDDEFSIESIRAFGANADRNHVGNVLSTVEGLLGAESHGPPNQQTMYDCVPCNPGVYAQATYIPYYIRLCPEFWSQPDWPYIMTHEFMHWMNTQDYAYGETDCRNLASSDPNRAARNADNYAMFIRWFR